MPTYAYKARDANGKLTAGFIEAEDESAAAAAIEKLGFSPVSISAGKGIFSFDSLISFFGFKKISRQELLVFTRQLSTLVSTGTSLIQSLNNVADQTPNPRFKQIIYGVVNSLESGMSFSAALAQHPEIFPNLYISLIKVGEAGGLLDKVLLRLAELSTREIDLYTRLRSALVYPVVLATVAFLIVNFVLVGVLPKFVTIFEASQARLPFPTRVLLLMSYLMRNFWWLIAAGLVLGLAWLRKYYRTRAGRFKIDALILRAPLFGSLILKILVSRFSRSIAALVKSGVPVLEALTVIEGTIPNTVLQRIIGDVRVAISGGQNLTEPFRASGLFPPMVIQLINTGERTGRLDEMFDQIANFYEPEIEFTMRNLTSLLEPIMLLAMGGVVAFIALSVLLPIFNLISIIRR